MEEAKQNKHVAILPDGLRELGRLERFKKGSVLFSAQDEADGFYYILRGEIRVYKMDEQGRELEVVRLGPGDFLGEAVVFVSAVFPVFAQAAANSEVLFFDRGRIDRSMAKDPHLAKYFVDLLARKCLVLSSRIESLGLRTVRQRLIRYLLTRCSGEQRCVVELKIKKGELAKTLGTISETLSRNLKQMQEEGLIAVKGNAISIKNCPALRKELLSI